MLSDRTGLHITLPAGYTRAARAFSIAENVAKVRLRIMNCFRISFKLQRNKFLRPRQVHVDKLALRGFWVVQALGLR